MKLDRLISILVLLLRRERIQARELSEIFEVSVRTILRDVDTLNLAGIPIVTYQGVNGGIGIAEGYRLDRSIFTSDDMASIIAFLKGIAKTIPDTKHDILVEKLKNSLTEAQLEKLTTKASQLVIDYEPWGENGTLKEKTGQIRSAIEASKMIEFLYSDSEGRKTKRTVEPYSIVLKLQNWYLYAWCLMRNDFRFFKVSRIKEMVIIDTVFNPRDLSFNKMNWENQRHKSSNMVRLELIFEAEMTEIVEEFFGEEFIHSENGKFMINLEMPENNWLYGFLLSFGNKVEVVNPPHIRKIIAKTAEKMCNLYKQP